MTLTAALPSLRLGRRAARTRVRRPDSAARAAPVLLEERQVVGGLPLRDYGAPGFWETHGYHMYGDPGKQQRYAGD